MWPPAVNAGWVGRVKIYELIFSERRLSGTWCLSIQRAIWFRALDIELIDDIHVATAALDAVIMYFPPGAQQSTC